MPRATKYSLSFIATPTGSTPLTKPENKKVSPTTIRQSITMGLSSYKQLPIVAYQINTKYRDEIRPRYGVMRGREFTMKDAYSFHANQECLDATYDEFAKAYRNIFKRLGLTVIPVRADSGAMGGTGSEEFMVESEVGDDTLIICPTCGYAANTEKASCASDWEETEATTEAVKSIDTPNVKTIEACNFNLNVFLMVCVKSIKLACAFFCHSRSPHKRNPFVQV